ncbi:Hsp20/alpha crystallin family protein [Arenibacter sp. GZD96]|uniref:Hsp20/alpha crystallin family protein n=1 Tax=Aurantibrevibacter litoralis TaxID=3106030 RepID=UPI002AFF9884|nr:Hsp20/alpha crystallin family protein [Arenibacter sp. GZD-96]MEA1787105.1 Hsp20/alpha crystallin family protein [Arenibacter sp. GZD-96]
MSIVKRSNVLFPSFVNEVFKPDWFGGLENFQTQIPPINIQENERDFILELAVPGRKKEDFNIEIDKDILTVSAEQKTENTTEEETYTRREFGYSAFKRAFTLPETVNVEAVNAVYEDGILRFALPKKEEALPKPKRFIEIA